MVEKYEKEKIGNHKGRSYTAAALILSVLILLSGCNNDNKKESKTNTNKAKIEMLDSTLSTKKSKFNETNIEETREYKTYKLKLNSIVPIKKDLENAKIKVQNNAKLKSILSDNDMSIERLLPMIIKESGMDNSKVSHSGATGYLQLRDIAIKDIEKAYNLKDLHLDVKDPVDNIIMGALYYKRNYSLVKTELNGIENLNLSENDIERLNIISYNAGTTRITKLLKESKAQNIDELINFIRKKLGFTGEPTYSYDNHYHIHYFDPLNGKKISDLNMSKEDTKLAESIRYLMVIDGIKSYINEKSEITILQKIECNKEKSLFSQIKSLRDKGYFKKDSSINEICKIILESNGYGEDDVSQGVELILIKDVLIDYLP